MVRVIAGKVKRKKLLIPKEGVRPTLDRIKESVFNILGEDVKKYFFLDLFAGSGSMGIGALSRGAPSAVFVEKERPAADVVIKNLSACNFSAKLYRIDALSALNMVHLEFPEAAFIVYVDPPFKENISEKVLESKALGKLVSEGGKVLIEHPSSKKICFREPWESVRKKKYGNVSVSFFEKMQT